MDINNQTVTATRVGYEIAGDNGANIWLEVPLVRDSNGSYGESQFLNDADVFAQSVADAVAATYTPAPTMTINRYWLNSGGIVVPTPVAI